MISVRLSWHEYRTFQEASAASGLRSISELARVAMKQLVSEQDAKSPEAQTRELCRQLTRLIGEMERMGETLREKAAIVAVEAAAGSNPK